MRRHIATALLVGMGIAIERPQLQAREPARSDAPTKRIERGAVCRVCEFGHLKSAGRVRKAEIAKLFVDEGMLFAEWSGQISAQEPRRIETEEIDAEWMAHVKGERWFLARRELLPSNGKMSSVQVYGDANDAAKVQLVAMVNEGRDAFTASYIQSSESARLSVRGNHDGRIVRSWSASAATLANLREQYPIIFETYLQPAIQKMAC